MKDEQDIDRLFRRGLTEPVDETGFREDDWDNLEQLLDGNKKRRGIVYWLPIISSVAAMVLLVLGWWLFKPQQTNIGQKPKQIAAIAHPKQIQKPNAGNNGSAASNLPATTANPSGIDGQSVAATKATPNLTTGNPDIYAGNLTNKTTNAAKTKLNSGGTDVADNTKQATNKQPSIKAADQLVAFNTTWLVDDNTVNRQYINTIKPYTHEIENNGYVKMLAAKRNQIITTSSFKHPQFALTLIGAPEVNGVNSFANGKTGTSAGLMFSVNVNKLSITTGVAYSKKPYNTSFDNYHNTSYVFKTSPIDVIADCRAIDIPLNVDYQVYNKHQNKISVGTGVSSYLMMHESYNYDYADPATKGPRSYTIASPGRYLFGVLNLQATYQRQINSKVGISVQPYLKLPLTNIGASEVKLQSAGVALGLSWNINSLTKP